MKQSSASSFDCRRLLQYAVRTESDCAATVSSSFTGAVNFGHPDPPVLHIFAVQPNLSVESSSVPPTGLSCNLLVAYTKHTVSAQLISTMAANHPGVAIQEDIKEICLLLPHESTSSLSVEQHRNQVADDEQISCLAVLAQQQQQEKQRMPASGSSTSITSTSSLMKGVIHTDGGDNAAIATTVDPPQQQLRLAIVFGTNYSRVYTVEVAIVRSSKNHAFALQRVQLQNAFTSTRSSLFQVFPFDDMKNEPSTEHQKRRRSWKRRLSQSSHKTSFAHPEGETPFCPTGGVKSVSSYPLNSGGSTFARPVEVVWITYGDATLVRLHSAAFFPSLWQRAAANGLTVEQECVRLLELQPGVAPSDAVKPLVRCKISLPAEEIDQVMVVPLPRHFPSPLSPLRTILPPSCNLQENSNFDLSAYEQQQRVNSMDETFETLVFGQGANNLFPTLCFYTSERCLDGRREAAVGGRSSERSSEFTSPNNDDSQVLGFVTKALVGSAMGVLRWGLGSTNSSNNMENAHLGNDESRDQTDADDAENSEHEPASSPFPSLRSVPVELYASTEFHDAPRKIEFCSIDPEGKLAAAADGLGRVLLIDLATRQLIRMWKGFREASCYWLQTIEARQEQNKSEATISPSRQGRRRKPLLHLVIHSHQRRVVEVWRVRHGGRVCSIPVGRDARILPFTSWSDSSKEALASCYLVHSTVPGASMNQMVLVRVEETKEPVAATGHDTPQRNVGSATGASIAYTPSRKSSLRLQHLQQLLSAGNIQYSKEDVRNALHEIKSLADLSTALDLLAAGYVLEERLGVEGSAFHRDALNYCRGELNSAVHRGKARNDSMARENPHVQTLSHKIEYHTQIVKAFDVLYKFEATKQDASQQQAKTPSHWAAEAMAWASTYEQVTGSRLDANDSEKSRERILFSEFAASCKFPEVDDGVNSPIKVFFSESSRTRRDVLEHVFKPLLADVFSFNVVYSVFDFLGTRSDCVYVQQCFGEWFMTLSVRAAFVGGLASDAPPMVRLLQDLVARQLASGPIADDEVALGVLCTFCEQSSDLVRSFMLGALCLEAVSRASTHKEKWSYGKVQSTRMVNDWKALLRKLRVCLLVSLRMQGQRLAAPVTVENVNQADIFSVYEWLARDELSMSHNHEEIVSLEKACSISSYAFDPSMPDGDGPSRFKMLQNSCLSAAISEEERAEYLVDFDDDDRFGALLLFLRSHNEPKILASHRALLLSSEWGSKPEQIDRLKDAVVALKSLHRTPGFISLAAAVCLEIWQTQLCPVYRAHLFGFADVHQVSEEAISPLLQNREWLSAVGRVGLQLLAILKDCNLDDKPDAILDVGDSGDDPSWPPLRPDYILKRLVDKMPRKLDESALGAHSVVVCALLVSGDIETLMQCVPAIYDLFLPLSLFKPVSSSSDVSELKQSYLNDAVFKFASEYSGPAFNSFDLGEIELLAKVWSFDIETVRTVFLLAMYELGKDSAVDELVTKATFQVDVHRFVEDGVSIACQRLNVFLSGSRLHSSGIRDVMGLLDADLCEWIKERAKHATSLVERPELVVAIESTHLFVMRLLSLSARSNVETTLRVRIHSLVVLSGILVKTLAGSSTTTTRPP